MQKAHRGLQVVLLTVFALVFTWSAIRPHDYFTWFLEVVPALVALIILFVTGRRFPLTDLAYELILLHSVILMVGGHYTYAEVPLGEWMKDWLGSERNNYDKIGHFAQGFIPAILAREILIRYKVVNYRGWRNFIIVCICLAVSACYEFIEWFAAVTSGTAAEAFLGSQGYVWDTQSDMLYATMTSLSSRW